MSARAMLMEYAATDGSPASDAATGLAAPLLVPRPVPVQDSLLLPMFWLPAICLSVATGTYYARGELSDACSKYYTASRDNEISTYLCCEPEYWFGLLGLSALGGFGLAGSFQVASILRSAFPPTRNPVCFSSCCGPRERGKSCGCCCCNGMSFRAACCQFLFVAMALGAAGVGIFDVCSQPSRHYLCATLFFTCGGLFMASYTQHFLVAATKRRHESRDSGHYDSYASPALRPTSWLRSQDHRTFSSDQHLKSVDVWDVGCSGSAPNNDTGGDGGIGRVMSDTRPTGRFNARLDRNGMPHSTSMDGGNSGLLPQPSAPFRFSKLPNVPSDDVVVQGMSADSQYVAFAGHEGFRGIRGSRSSETSGRNGSSSSFLTWVERIITSAYGRALLLTLYWVNYGVVVWKLHGPTNVDGTLVDATFKLPLEWLAVICLAAQVLVCHADLVSDRHAIACAVVAASDADNSVSDVEADSRLHASTRATPMPYAPPAMHGSGSRPFLPPPDRTVSVFSEGAQTHRTSTLYSEHTENGGGVAWEGPSWAHPSTWGPSRDQRMASRRERRASTTTTAPRDDVPARKVLPSESSADESSILSDLTMSETGRDSPERPDPSASPPASPDMNSAEALEAHYRDRQPRRGTSRGNAGGGYANSLPNHRRGGAPRFFAQASSPKAGLQRAVSFEQSVAASVSFDLRGASAIRENSLVGGDSVAASESVAMTTSFTDESGDNFGGGHRQQQQQQWTPCTPESSMLRGDPWANSPLHCASTPPRGGPLKFASPNAENSESTPSRQVSAAQRSMSNSSFLPAYPATTDASIAESYAPTLSSRFEPSSPRGLDGVFE